MPRELRRVGSAGLALLSAVALLACDATGGAQERQIWIGAVAGTDAVIGLAVRGDRVSGYVCGGPETYATHTVWFYAHREADDAGPIEIERGAWRLGITLAGEVASGTLRHGDEPAMSWMAVRPPEGSGSDIYSARGDGCRHGAILLYDSATGARRLQGTWCDGPDVIAQVTPVHPVIHDDGVEIEIAPEGTVTRVILEPVLR